MGRFRGWGLLVSLLVAAGGLALSLALLASPARAQGGTLSGTVVYVGSHPGTATIYVAVFTHTSFSPVAVTGIANPGGPYGFSGLADGTYYVRAYLDLDGSGGAPDEGEPFAWYDPGGDGIPDGVLLSGDAGAAGIALALSDPWRPLGGPVLSPALQIDVRALAHNPVTPALLYALADAPPGSNTRLYRSRDGGRSWTAVHAAAQLNALAAHGPFAYAGGVGGYGVTVIFRSLDGGITWEPALAGPEGYQSIRALAVDPLTPTTVYAAGAAWGGFTGGTVYRSDDAGLSWTRVLSVPAGSGSADLLTLAINPVTPTQLYVGGYRNDGLVHRAVLYRTTDGGLSWSQVYSEADAGGSQQFTSLVVHPLTPTRVYAGSQAHKYVYRSLDGGLSWTRVFTDSGFRLALDPPGTLYTADDWREIYRSPASGDAGSWSKVGDNTPGDIRAFVLEPESGVLTLGFQGLGVYQSRDGGLTWIERNTGIRPLAVLRDLAGGPGDPDRLFAAAGCDGGWSTADGGESWTRLPLTPCVTALTLDPGDPAILYAGSDGDRGPTLLRSLDGGLTFTPVYTAPFIQPDGTGGSAALGVIAAAPAMSQVVYAGGTFTPAGSDPYGVVLRSLNQGLAWTELVTIPHAAVRALAVDPLDTDWVYVGGEICPDGSCSGFLTRAAGKGLSWTQIQTTPVAVRSIVVDFQKPSRLYTADVVGAVYRSDDRGATWAQVHAAGGAAGAWLTMDPGVPSHLYLALPGAILESPDGGASWSTWSAPLNQGTAGLVPTALTPPAGTPKQIFYAGSASGLWSYARLAPQPGAPATLTVQLSAGAAPVGSSVAVTALVVDRHENWAAGGTVVTFTSSMAGSLPVEPFAQLLSDGRAAVTLSGLRPGRTVVTITAGTLSARLQVAFGEFAYLPLLVR